MEAPLLNTYDDSTQTLTAIRETAAIDIKPGSDPNCININGHGVIPVAILGSEDFDVSLVDPDTLYSVDWKFVCEGTKDRYARSSIRTTI